METLEEVYGALTGQGRLEWIGEKKTAAALYFNRGHKQYKVYFDDSNVEVSVKKRFFGREYWDSVGLRRYISPEDTLDDVFDTVLWCVKEYGWKGK